MSALSPILYTLTGLAFASWAVYMGGLASLQKSCASATVANSGNHGALLGITGFTDLPCYHLYRFYWFIMSIEIFSVVALAVALGTGNIAKSKLSFVGLFSINTILFILASNSFLSANSLNYYNHDSQKHRMRATVAGAIMTAVANVVLTLVLGYEEDASAPEVQVQKEQAAV